MGIKFLIVLGTAVNLIKLIFIVTVIGTKKARPFVLDKIFLVDLMLTSKERLAK
jgi:hypothetical protein